MPTGYTEGRKGSMARSQTGAYREKNIHGVHGAITKRNVSIRSFSLTQENARYLDGVNKGHKSEVVNRALNFYRHSPERTDLLENIEALQLRITELYQERDEIAGSRQVADNKTKEVSPSRGWRRFFKFRWP